MITASFLKCGITNNLDGTEDDSVYDSIEDTGELDDSFIAELFASNSESDFELLLVGNLNSVISVVSLGQTNFKIFPFVKAFY